MAKRTSTGRADGRLEELLADARRAAEELARRGGADTGEALAMWERILDDPLLVEVLQESPGPKRPWRVEQGRIVFLEPPTVAALHLLRGRGEHEEGDAGEAVGQRRQPPRGEAERLPGVSVPVPLSRFVGREHELEKLRERVARERLITVAGSGGSGKTRLVQEFVRSHVEPGEALLVDLAPVPDPTLVAREVATKLGRQEGGIGSFIASVQQAEVPFEERLAESLGDRRLLLVLDNCERVVNACADLVKVLLERCPNLRVICTSREILDLEGEQIYRLPSLPLPPADVALADEEIAEFESVRLFLDRARAKQPDLRPTHEELAIIAEICRGVDGIPYAIELAAARVDVLSLRQILERLDQQLDWLRSGGARVAARQKTMQDMIDWSHALLTAQEQTLLRRLAVFRGGFTLEACEEVCAFEELDRASILPLLGALVGKSLVETKPVGDGIRYWLLETTRRFAQERCAQAGEDVVTRAQHRQWCLRLAERAAPHLRGPDQARWFDELEAELENLRAALQPIDPAGAGERLRLVGALQQFLLVRGHVSEGAAHLARALDENREPSTTRATVLAIAAEFAISEGRLDDAREIAQDALPLARRYGNRRAEALALRVLGVEELRRRPSKRARKLLLESRRTAESIDRSAATGFADIYLGKHAEAIGDYGEARRCYERAEGDLREAQSLWTLGWALLSLGELDLRENDFARADDRLSEALDLARAVTSRQLIVLTLLSLGNSAHRRDDQDLAAARYEQAMQAMERLDEDTSLALVRASMAKVAVARGDLGAARRWLSMVDWRAPLLRLPARAQILRSHGLYLAAIGEFDEAEARYRQALALWHRLHDHRRMLEGLEALALLALRAGRLDRAAALHAVTSTARARTGVEPPPVSLHDIEALAATVEGRLPAGQEPVRTVAEAIADELRQAR